MRIDGYEVNNGRVIAVFITDKKRNMKQHKYEPARPHGEWKAKTFHDCYCTNCGFTFDIMKCDFMGDMNFCNKCGADMRKKEGEAE